MPEIKHDFTAGKMNKDVDERLVQNGEYRNALNIQVKTTDGDADSKLGDAGTAQNIKGNVLSDEFVSMTNYIDDNFDGEKEETRIIGSVADEANNKAYFFAAAPVPSYGLLAENPAVIADAGMNDAGVETRGLSERVWIDSIKERPTNAGPRYIFVDRFAVTSTADDVMIGNTNAWDSFPATPSNGYSYITVADASKYRIGMVMYAQKTVHAQTEVDGHLLFDNDGITPGVEIINIVNNDLILATQQTVDLEGLIRGLDTDTTLSVDSVYNGTNYASGAANPNYNKPKGVIKFIHPERVLEFDYYKTNYDISLRVYNTLTNINIIDDLLFWSDGKHEPKKINIKRSKAGTSANGITHTKLYVTNPTSGNLEEVSTDDGDGIENLLTSDIKREHITVIRKAPRSAPTLHMSVSDRPGDVSGQIVYEFAPAGQPFPVEGSIEVLEFPAGLAESCRIGDVFKFTTNSAFFNEPAVVRAKVVVISGDLISLEIISISNEVLASNPDAWEINLEQRKPLFETKFGRFAYRYQYEDGEYSSFSPWSELAFLPGSFEYTPSKGFNKGMVNNVRSLVIKDFIPNDNIRPSDVKMIDVLWKATDNANVYIVKSITREVNSEWEMFDVDQIADNTGSMVVTTEMIYKVVEANQLLRGWDNVPKAAIAQEITANRLIYGNYNQGYSIDSAFGVKQSLESKKVLFPIPLKSVKSIRNYQFGVVFGDEYGRETPVIANGWKTELEDGITETVSGDLIVQKGFAGYSNKFKLEQNWDGGSPIDWMDYTKYFVKETSNEYYNLVMDRWYDAKDGNIWISFPSADRNKIDEETYLILKNGHGAQKTVTEEARYKVIAIENDAPDYIKTVNRDYDMIFMPSSSVYSGAVTDGKPNALIGDTDDLTTDYRKVLCDPTSWKNVDPKSEDFKGDPKARIIGYFVDSNSVKYYGYGPWKNISKLINKTDDDEYGVVFRELLEEGEVNMYQKILGQLSTPTDLSDIQGTIDNNYTGAYTATIKYYLQLRDAVVENKPEFDGRFFVKIEKDDVIQTHILGSQASYEVDATYKIAYIDAYSENRGNFDAEHLGPYNTEDDADGDGVDDNTWPSDSVFTAAQMYYTHEYNYGLDSSNTTDNIVVTWTGGGEEPQEITYSTIPDGNISVSNVLVNPADTVWSTGINPSNEQSVNEDVQTVPLFGPGDTAKTEEFWNWWKGNDEDGQPRRSTNIFIDGATAYSGFNKMVNLENTETGGTQNRSVMRFIGGFEVLSHYKDGVIYGPYPSGATWPNEPYDWEDEQNWKPSGLSRAGDVVNDELNQLTFSIIGNHPNWDDPNSPFVQEDSQFKAAMMNPGTFFRFANDPYANTYKVVSYSQSTWDEGYGDFGEFSGPIEIESENIANSGNTDVYKRHSIITRFVRLNGNLEIPNTGIDTSIWDPRGEAKNNGIGSLDIQILQVVSASGDLSDRGVVTNAACWETEPKEDVGLDIYHEASEAIPVKLKDLGHLISFTKPSEDISRASKVSCKFREVELSPDDDIENIAGEEIYLPPTTYIAKVLGNDAVNIKWNQAGSYVDLTSDLDRTGICLATNDLVAMTRFDRTTTRSKILDHYTISDVPGDIDVPILSPRATRTLAVYSGGQMGEFLYGTDAASDIDGNSIVGTEVTGVGVPNGTFVIGASNADPTPQYPFSPNIPGYSGPIIKVNRKISAEATGFTFKVITGWFKIDTEVWNYPIDLGWFNCYSFGNGVESDRIRDDFNAPQIDNGVKVSATFLGYEEETMSSNLIYSGIYNSSSSTNNLNEFNMAEKITKNLNPSYGSIQALKARDGDLVVFTEDKVLKVQANKHAVYNADNNPQLVATNMVLGQAIPFAGDFGISKNPESLASDEYRLYFTDKQRGAVLRLSGNGITPISDVGMKTYFRDKLKNADLLIGTFDGVSNEYNLTVNHSHKITTIEGQALTPVTVSFNEESKGWVSFKSFLPSSGLSVGGKYYTSNTYKIWQHHSTSVNSLYNNFYGTQYESEIEVVFNDSPSTIKSFKTINYEGSQSKVNAYTGSTVTDAAGNTIEANDGEYYNLTSKLGWYVDSFNTDLQEGKAPEFINKENKWFNNIVGITTTLDNLDTNEFSVQGLGIPSAVLTDGASETELTIEPSS